jgi:class 3 adenylate cyclase
VNSGVTFVGMVSRGTGSEFTAFGDAINVAAHLATQAGIGEILTTDATVDAAEQTPEPERRRAVSLKGRQVDAIVLSVGDVGGNDDGDPSASR